MRRDVFDRYRARIWTELRKLEATTSDQPIARRNARKRVLTAMRGLRGAIDKAFPPIVDRTGVVRLKTSEGRIARLKRANWRQISYTEVHKYAVEGIRVRKVRIVNGANNYTKWFLPSWAVAIGPQPARLREAKKSRKVRAAAIVAEAL